MTWTPYTSQLHGFAYPAAECYGKPHFLCRYEGESVNSHKLFDGATCMCCGRPATNAHHWPIRSSVSTFTLNDKVLKPALFAVCGHGTTGCHNGWHGGSRFKALWKWDHDDYAVAWWDGEMLDNFEPHDQALYNYGCWEVYDLKAGKIWQVRL